MSTQIAKVGPYELLKVAVDKDLDIEKLKELMIMQTTWEAKEARKTFFKAMSKFQGLCPIIKKKKDGASFKDGRGNKVVGYKYAPMSDIIAQVGKLITKCGLCYRFEQIRDQNNITVICIVSHIDGHSESVPMVGERGSNAYINSNQNSAATVTLLTRYTFLGSFGIATADEDMDGRLPEEFQAPKPSQYTEEKFKENFPKWEKAIRADMLTIEDVIAKAESKAPLTKAQENQIKGIK